MAKGLKRLLRIVTLILIPILLMLASVRLILASANIWIPLEYKLPGFPVDFYGFTLEDRIYWSSVDLDFLLGNEDIDYFDSFFLKSGAPMHNDRELKHMADVKWLVDKAWVGLKAGTALLIILAAGIWWMDGRQEVGAVLQKGAKWSLIGMVLLVIGVLFAFGFLFVGFHRLFFEGTTWLFAYSDTFIRLYPERFWRDTFIYVIGVNALLAGMLHLISKGFQRRK